MYVCMYVCKQNSIFAICLYGIEHPISIYIYMGITEIGFIVQNLAIPKV